jgi:hypothetical protein
MHFSNKTTAHKEIFEIIFNKRCFLKRQKKVFIYNNYTNHEYYFILMWGVYSTWNDWIDSFKYVYIFVMENSEHDILNEN